MRTNIVHQKIIDKLLILLYYFLKIMHFSLVFIQNIVYIIVILTTNNKNE